MYYTKRNLKISDSKGAAKEVRVRNKQFYDVHVDVSFAKHNIQLAAKRKSSFICFSKELNGGSTELRVTSSEIQRREFKGEH